MCSHYEDQPIMSEIQKYPIGVQNFEKIIRNGFLYVDKTEFIYRLVTKGEYYSLSRPRKFGKSLLLSTLEAFFLGKRELFKGLAIESHDDLEWNEYPVLHLDLNAQDYSNDDTTLAESAGNIRNVRTDSARP